MTPPTKYKDYVTYFGPEGEGIVSFSSTTDDAVSDPLNREQALASPQAHDWQAAMNKEFAALQANNTFTYVKLPPGARPLSGKWVLTVKRNAQGMTERFKASWVVKGFQQIYGLEYTEISAPVAKLPTIRTIFAVAATNDWDILQMDTDTAFLHGTLKEEICMEQPHGFHVGDENTVCRPDKSLYGLKQAPRVWHDLLKSVFEALGFTISCADASVFLLEQGSTKSFAIIYVDDQLDQTPS